MSPRLSALNNLLNVIQDQHSLTDSLSKNPTDRAFIQALCFGVCRTYFKLDAVAQQLLQKPLKQKDQDVYLLILMGLYQMMEMHLPDYAAISETVAVAESLKKPWAKGLINAVLRNYQRNPIHTQHNAHPLWMTQKIEQDWPEQASAILNANNEHPPLVLRVNQKKISREAYLHKVAAFPILETEAGICLKTPVDVKEIPGFFEGEVSVQDGAAQLAAPLLQVQSGQRVLDACAAPGGKTAHILEITDDIELIALDHDSDRLDRVRENLERLGLSASYLCADAGDTTHWWDGNPFDRILLDAPCSATGVIRRHPDIKLLRRASDVAKLAKEQSRLLESLWPLLKVNGLLVYATCSLWPDENMNVVRAFISSHSDAIEQKIEAHWGLSCSVGRQILPGMHGMDGFYYACLRKCS